MTDQMLIVFGVLAGAVALFASGRVRPDVVAILVVLAIQEALAGFGQPVVVLIAAVSDRRRRIDRDRGRLSPR